jgi:hypothetical protein
MCVIAVVGTAPCQCFSPGANQTTSPGRISSTGPPQRCARPQPEVTISVCPSGCVCQAVRAPGSNVTLAPTTRAGSGAANRGSIRTEPVNQSAGPLPEGWDPLRLISIASPLPQSSRRRSRKSRLRSGRLQQNPSRCTPEAPAFNGFFLKKKPPCTLQAWALLLGFGSSGLSWPRCVPDSEHPAP